MSRENSSVGRASDRKSEWRRFNSCFSLRNAQEGTGFCTTSHVSGSQHRVPGPLCVGRPSLAACRKGRTFCALAVGRGRRDADPLRVARPRRDRPGPAAPAICRSDALRPRARQDRPRGPPHFPQRAIPPVANTCRRPRTAQPQPNSRRSRFATTIDTTIEGDLTCLF